jgi:hypothetical protein
MTTTPYELISQIGDLAENSDALLYGKNVSIAYERHARDNWTDEAILTITDDNGDSVRLRVEVSEVPSTRTAKARQTP